MCLCCQLAIKNVERYHYRIRKGNYPEGMIVLSISRPFQYLSSNIYLFIHTIGSIKEC